MTAVLCWLACVDSEPAEAWGAARLGQGWLAAWRQDDRPVPDALLADPAALDPGGEAAWISLA